VTELTATLSFTADWKAVSNLLFEKLLFVTSGFRLEEDENSAVLGYYKASNNSFSPPFLDGLSVSYLGIENPKEFLTDFSGQPVCTSSRAKNSCILDPLR
jgi:hypothetical protein